MLTPHQANYIAHDLTAQNGGGALPGAWPHVLESAPTVEIREVARLFIASFERPILDVVTGRETSPVTPKKRQRNTKELLLQALQAQPGLTVKALALAMHLSDASVRDHLRVLQVDKKLRRVGSTKGGRWEVTAPDPKENP